jgi:hypothetical protein
MNKTRSFRLFAVVLFFTILLPSPKAQEPFYMHMSGTIGDGISMNADLIRIDDKISGYYYYFFMDTLARMDFGMRYGKALPVDGTIMADNSLEFSEFSKEIRGAIFKGALKDGVITGEWVSSDGKKTIPFILKEIYPEGTIAFNVYHLKDKGLLFEKKNSPAANIDLTLLLPKPYANAAPVDSVNDVIFKEFFTGDSALTDPMDMLRYARELYFNNYRKANTDIYQEGASSFEWFKNKAVKIQYNENNFLSLEFFDYGSTGGAHGLSISKFAVINLQDGNMLSLDTIFRPDYVNDLRDILNVQVRRQLDIEPGKDLREAGFFVEFIDPTDNFYLNKDGIGFYYNQYDVAPFATGPVDVFVPYRMLKRIMDPSGPLYKAVMEQQ